jgi:hypothetical protein
MILFKKRFIEPILSGEKTQTRRTGKKRWNIGSIHQARLSYYGKPFAHLRILDVRRERVGDISEADARAEGVGSSEEFVRLWPEINGEWDPDLEVWVVEFELAEVG